jgi:hypothetical protein
MNRDKREWPRRRRIKQRDVRGILFGIALLAFLLLLCVLARAQTLPPTGAAGFSPWAGGSGKSTEMPRQ